jgi:hypothetical protein
VGARVVARAWELLVGINMAAVIQASPKLHGGDIAVT